MYLFVIATLCCFSEYLIGIIIKYVLTWIYSVTKLDKLLRTELMKIKQEMNQLSMIDEFPKYAKLQRKYNKLETELKEKVNSRISSKMKVRLVTTYALHAVNLILISALLYIYRGEPVAVLPNGMLSPLENFFKWPGNYEGGISLTMWILITKTAASYCNVIG